MKWKLLFNTASVLAVTLAMLGCSTFNRELDSAKRFKNYPKPIYGWDTTLIEKYRASVDKDKNKDKLQFIETYNGKITRKQTHINNLLTSEGSEIAEAEKALANARKKETALLDELAKLNKSREILEQVRTDLTALSLTNQEIITGNVEVVDAETQNDKTQPRQIKSIGENLLPEVIREIEAKKKEVAAVRAEIKNKEQQLELKTRGIRRIEEQMRFERNKIIGELILLAKAYHNEREDLLYLGRASFNVALDAVQIATTSIATVTGSESTARALAALATGAKGFQESADKNFFYQHATAALLATMHTIRIKNEKVLIEKMSLDVYEYPLEVALDDWATYMLCGSVADALREMSGKAAARELEALESLDELKKMSDEQREMLRNRRMEREANEQTFADYEQQIKMQLYRRMLTGVGAGY